MGNLTAFTAVKIGHFVVQPEFAYILIRSRP